MQAAAMKPFSQEHLLILNLYKQFIVICAESVCLKQHSNNFNSQYQLLMMLYNGGQECIDQNNPIKFHKASTTTSDCSHQNSLPQMPALNGLKKSTSFKRDWEKISDKIMVWFSSKKIESGSPESIHLEPTQAKKRQICMSNQKVEVKNDGLLGRRLGRSLTISL